MSDAGYTRPVRLLLLPLVAAALVSGCGSNADERSGVPLGEYRAQADRICSRAAEVYEKGGGLQDLSGPRGVVLRKLARGFDTMADGFETLHREIVALPEPHEQAGAARRLEEAFAAFAAHHRRASDRAAAGDVDGLKTTLNSEIGVKERMAAATDALKLEC